MTTGPERNAADLTPTNPVAAFSCAGQTDAIRVVFVEDDPYYRETLAEELSERGFVVRSFGDGASLLDSLDAAAEADVIILDGNLLTTSGINLLPLLSQHSVNLPVVLLTRRSLAAYKSVACDRGATDFIDKASGVEVLVRRLRHAIVAAQLAAEARHDKLMVCGRLMLSPTVSRAHWDDIDIGLTLGEYNIVHLLASNAGHYVTYRAIYDRLRYEGFVAGDGSDGYKANVRSAIRRIRNKFRDRDPGFVEIENYTAFGYCWRKPDGAA